MVLQVVSVGTLETNNSYFGGTPLALRTVRHARQAVPGAIHIHSILANGLASGGSGIKKISRQALQALGSTKTVLAPIRALEASMSRCRVGSLWTDI